MPTLLYASITPLRRTSAAIIRVQCFGTGKLKCANPVVLYNPAATEQSVRAICTVAI